MDPTSLSKPAENTRQTPFPAKFQNNGCYVAHRCQKNRYESYFMSVLQCVRKSFKNKHYFNHQLFVVNVSIGYRLLFWQQSHAISGGVTGTPVTTISSIELGLLYLFNKSDVFFIFYI